MQIKKEKLKVGYVFPWPENLTYFRKDFDEASWVTTKHNRLKIKKIKELRTHVELKCQVLGFENRVVGTKTMWYYLGSITKPLIKEEKKFTPQVEADVKIINYDSK